MGIATTSGVIIDFEKKLGDKFIEYTSLLVFDAVNGQYTSVSGAVPNGCENHSHYIT